MLQFLRPNIAINVSMSVLSVCLSLCLTERMPLCVFSHISKPHVKTSRIFLCLLILAVTRAFSDDHAIRYVLSVLWMTSWSRIKHDLMICRVRQIATPGAKLLSTIAGLL